MGNKIDITSTAIEKGIDLAKDFLDKLIIPTIEETGLLIKDKVTMWRFNNQVKMLVKAKETCDKYNIKPKTVSLKLLCPLLEYAGLEENEILQDKWANLLANLVDSEQNIENHVFPYLLSQVSLDEFMMLEMVYKMKVERTAKLEAEFHEFQNRKPSLEQTLRDEVLMLEKEMEKLKDRRQLVWEIEKKKRDKENELRELDSQERTLKSNLIQPEFIPFGLKDYEASNLIRLGVIKNIPKPYAYVGEHKIKNEPNSDYLYLQDLEVIIEADEDDLILTQLGELFISACNVKK